MSEATDAERDVEDFFNEEIFGAKAPVENEAPFPTTPPEPESKPAEEIASVVEETELEEGTVEEDIPEGETEEPPAEEGLPPAAEVDIEEPVGEPEETDDEYLVWAKKKYGDDLDLENDSARKLARAAWEQEKLLGKQAEQARRKEKEAQEREIQTKLDFLSTPGSLTPEEDVWIEDAVASGDAASYADALLNEGRADLYGAFVARWVQQGEREAVEALRHRDRVMNWVSQPQPSETESYAAALGETFVSLGLSIEQHGPLVLQKAEELGTAHPSVQGMMSPDAQVRRIATQAVVDLIRAGQTTVTKARTDDVVAARVQEEKLRQQAAGVTTGGPRVEKPKTSPFWDEFNAEIAERGWDGNRPSYGREE